MSDKEKTNGSLAMAPRVITIPAANQETARKLRVAAYTRVSSNSKDQEHSFAAQNAYFSKLITDNPDWELADIYADQGITGTSIDKRDDFLRMMEDCRKGRIDRILVKSSSRFARNTKESLAAVRELKSLNISVYFEEQNIDTAQVSGEVLRQTHLHGICADAAGAGVLHGERAMPWMPVSRPRYCLLAPGWRLSAHRYGRNRKEKQI